MAEEKSGALEGGTLTLGHFDKLAPLANCPSRAGDPLKLAGSANRS